MAGNFAHTYPIGDVCAENGPPPQGWDEDRGLTFSNGGV
jgi:hypothetical protein